MSGIGNVFPSQVMTPAQENTAIRSNMLIDWACGHKEIVENFVQKHPDFKSHAIHLSRLKQVDLMTQSFAARSNSLLMTVLMLTGNCNANCEVCYTDRKTITDGLRAEELYSILDQTHALGSELVYIPGEGEPTLDPAFWKLLDHAADLGMKVILFTNGIIFSDDSVASRRWGFAGVDALRLLEKYPVFIYHKLWSLQPEKHALLMGIQKQALEWSEISVGRMKYVVPSGFKRMIEYLPKDRIGVQVLADRRTYGEITQRIIPLIQDLGIKSFIEPVLHSGRMQRRSEYDLSDTELLSLDGWLSRSSCKRTAYKIVVHNDGTLSPGMAFNLNGLKSLEYRNFEYSIRNRNAGGVRDIFSLIHDLPIFVWSRYQIDACLCERANRWIAGIDEQPQIISMRHSMRSENQNRT